MRRDPSEAERSASLGGSYVPPSTGKLITSPEAPLVSVVITNYNYGQYIEQAINSVLTSTYQNTELIVINDGSTDDSMSKITRFKGSVKIVDRENRGLVFSRNEGLRLAVGDYVIFLDADNYWNDDYLSKYVNL